MQSKKRQMLTCAFDTKAQAPLRHRVYLVKFKKDSNSDKKRMPKVLLVYKDTYTKSCYNSALRDT